MYLIFHQKTISVVPNTVAECDDCDALCKKNNCEGGKCENGGCTCTCCGSCGNPGNSDGGGDVTTVI